MKTHVDLVARVCLYIVETASAQDGMKALLTLFNIKIWRRFGVLQMLNYLRRQDVETMSTRLHAYVYRSSRQHRHMMV